MFYLFCVQFGSCIYVGRLISSHSSCQSFHFDIAAQSLLHLECSNYQTVSINSQVRNAGTNGQFPIPVIDSAGSFGCCGGGNTISNIFPIDFGTLFFLQCQQPASKDLLKRLVLTFLC